MSKQIGAVNLDGRVGQISFHYRKGVASARLKSRGPSRDHIFNDPSMERVRENISEFAGLILMANAFSAALEGVKGMTDGTVRSRIMRLFAAVKKRSEGIRGKRPFNLSLFKSVLKNFELNAGNHLGSVLAISSGITSTPSAARNSAALQLTIDNPQRRIAVPSEATHYQLAHLLAVIPDGVFDPEAKAYTLTAPELNGVSVVSTSDLLPIDGTPVTVSLETTLPLETVPEQATVIEAVGIECFQEIAGVPYFLKEGRGMKIINAF